MKSALILSVALAAAAGPVLAQSWNDRYEAERRRAELDRWSARADAQAAESARLRAETRLRQRELEIQRNKGRAPGATLSEETYLRVDRIEADAAARQAEDARQRELDAGLRGIDAFLDSARGPN